MRRRLLANHIGCDINAIKESEDKKNLFEFGKSDYLVLTNEEANEEAKLQIRDSIWSFDSSLIMKHLKIEISAKIIEKVQSAMCPHCTLLLFALINDIDAFYKDILNEFNRGYFIAFHDSLEFITYDFEENKRYYIYRLS